MQNPPFNSISNFYKSKFGQKILKVPVSIATDCPNRQGLKNMQTCIFCDEWGSSAYPDQRVQELSAQIQSYKTTLGARYRSQAFFAYFQAYTSTFLGLTKLRKSFETALSFSEVQGLVIGTRPDCVSAAVLDLWQEYHQKKFVSVELGVQSFFDDQLLFLKRGHSAKTSIETIERIRRQTSVDLGIHLMFGLPNETDAHIVETARIVSNLGVDHVKLHNLHVLKNTPLEDLYLRGSFMPIEFEEYSRRVILFLQHLSPDIYIQRLGAVASRWDELVAPSWTRYKMRTYQFIIDQMNDQGAVQGQYFIAPKERYQQ